MSSSTAAESSEGGSIPVWDLCSGSTDGQFAKQGLTTKKAQVSLHPRIEMCFFARARVRPASHVCALCSVSGAGG